MCTLPFLSSQSGMYAALIKKVDSFRELIGAPDVDRFNIVLLGGIYTLHIAEHELIGISQ